MEYLKNQSHYIDHNGENTAKFIEEFLKDVSACHHVVYFYIGSMMKYLLRYSRKNGMEDLNKMKVFFEYIQDKGKEEISRNAVFKIFSYNSFPKWGELYFDFIERELRNTYEDKFRISKEEHFYWSSFLSEEIACCKILFDCFLKPQYYSADDIRITGAMDKLISVAGKRVFYQTKLKLNPSHNDNIAN